MTGPLFAGGAQALDVAQMRNAVISDVDIGEGAPLVKGALYFVTESGGG